MVYYYHRSTKEGVIYQLFREFEAALINPYHLLPLVRPTKFNAELSLMLLEKAKEYEMQTRAVAEKTLQRPEDVLQNDILKQVVSHDSVTRETLSSHREPVLWQPPPKTKPVVDSSSPNKRKRTTNVKAKKNNVAIAEVSNKKDTIGLVKDKKQNAIDAVKSASLIFKK